MDRNPADGIAAHLAFADVDAGTNFDADAPDDFLGGKRTARAEPSRIATNPLPDPMWICR
jgi:hypothetical protein